MAKKVNKQKNNIPFSQLEDILHQEANSETPIYGLEFIIDELYDNSATTKSKKNDQANGRDWFGFSDLSI
jgi:hypothetical protein